VAPQSDQSKRAIALDDIAVTSERKSHRDRVSKCATCTIVKPRAISNNKTALTRPPMKRIATAAAIVDEDAQTTSNSRSKDVVRLGNDHNITVSRVTIAAVKVARRSRGDFNPTETRPINIKANAIAYGTIHARDVAKLSPKTSAKFQTFMIMPMVFPGWGARESMRVHVPPLP
jgi:mannose-1-phosphate guanylyltransferase